MDAKPQQLMPNALNSISSHQMKLATSNPYPQLRDNPNIKSNSDAMPIDVLKRCR
jgi:hypothetical protein